MSGNVLKKIQEKISEKEEIIEEQMAQIVELEDTVAKLQQELEWLREIKVEYDKLKIQLDSLLGE